MQSKNHQTTTRNYTLAIAAILVLVAAAAPYALDDAFATKKESEKGRLHVTVQLADRTIPAGDWMLLMDTTPDKITGGHLAIKAPCDNPDSQITVLTGVAPNLKPTALGSSNIVNPLSGSNVCLYHMDLPPMDSGITDIAIKNTGKTAVNFGPTDTVTIYANSFEKKGDHHKTEAKSAHDYVEKIEHLLQEAKSAYSAGDSKKALDLATTAYLDNYEFIESEVDAHSHETNEEIEHKLREQLRSMIKEGAPASEVKSQINDILIMIEDIEGIFEKGEHGKEERHMEHEKMTKSKKEKTGHDYVENIEHLLQEVKRVYSQGNSQKALELAQEAYLDNYEHIESKVESHSHETNEKIEEMLKERLRTMIKDGVSTSRLAAHVNDLLIQIEDIEGLFEDDGSLAQRMESKMQESVERKEKKVPEEVRPQVKVNQVFSWSGGYRVTFTVESGNAALSNVKVLISSDKGENTTTISGMQERSSSLSTAIIEAKDPGSISAKIVDFDVRGKFRTNIGGG